MTQPHIDTLVTWFYLDKLTFCIKIKVNAIMGRISAVIGEKDYSEKIKVKE